MALDAGPPSPAGTYGDVMGSDGGGAGVLGSLFAAPLAEGTEGPTGAEVEAALAQEIAGTGIEIAEESIPMSATQSGPPPLVIEVGEPMKHHTGGLMGGSYVTYLIHTKTTLPSYGGTEFTVRRRFREVVSLATRLELKNQGYFVPPRPEKNVVEGRLQNADFIELRRLQLHRYMHKLARHSVLRESPILKLFLQYEGELANNIEWAGMKTLEGSNPETDLQGRWFKELGQKIKGKMGVVSATDAQVEEADSDEVLARKRAEFKEMEAVLSRSSLAAESLVQRMEKLATALGDFGLTCIKTSKFEDAEGERLGKYSEAGEPLRSIAQGFRRGGTASVRSSRLTRSGTESMAAHLTNIHDHLGLVPAARQGLRNRRQALLSYRTIIQEIDSKKRRVAELEQQGATRTADPHRTRKVAELKKDLEGLEVSKASAADMLEQVSKRNHEEVERYEVERREGHIEMLQEMCRVMQVMNERNAEIWSSYKTNTEPIDLGEEEEE